jgi:hypothetical protein
MAGTTTPTVKVAVEITGIEALAGAGSGVVFDRFHQLLNLANGTSDGQINRLYFVQETLKAASATTSYDLSGSLEDAFGDAVVFAEVCLIAIYNRRTTALANLNLGPHVTNGFGRLASSLGFWPADAAADADQGSIVMPEGWLVLYNPGGVPVTAGSGDILAVITSAVVGSTNSWDLMIAGRSV